LLKQFPEQKKSGSEQKKSGSEFYTISLGQKKSGLVSPVQKKIGTMSEA